MEKQNIDQYGRSLVTESDLCKRLYNEPKFDFSKIEIDNADKYNAAISALYLPYPKLKTIEKLTDIPREWHDKNSSTWLMPEKYQQMNIVEWLLDKCKNETEIQRTASELLLYAERDMLDLLKYLKFLVDTMRENGVLWGVGRGSSVASFVLYLIGIHRINSITYDLKIEEFIRDNKEK